LVRTAKRYVPGIPPNTVMSSGDRGTGKSSTVKALLNALAPRGLRLVEIPKEALGDFPRLVALLRGRRERFLLFVDDLSFEEHETEYKALKAVLEGSLETRPDNLVLYATSNRRHLVRQRFDDRDSAADDIHPGDTVEEKLSLSDRFGLRVRFLAPDQSRYLAIARALAERHGLALPREELETRALRWAARHGGRSARTARQFGRPPARRARQPLSAARFGPWPDIQPRFLPCAPSVGVARAAHLQGHTPRRRGQRRPHGRVP
jgi:predicted AAA+ superfamily ATPase